MAKQILPGFFGGGERSIKCMRYLRNGLGLQSEDWNKIPQNFKFDTAPSEYWNNSQNQREFMGYLGAKLGFQSMEDWYTINKESFIVHGGGKLLLYHYNSSPSKAVKSIFIHHNWENYKFSTVPNGYWESNQNQREFLEHIGAKLGYKSMEDWYNISYGDFVKNGGRGLLSTHYNDSPSKCVTKVFSDKKWLYWLFRNQKGDIKDPQYTSWFSEKLDVLKSKIGINQPDQWYDIGIENVRKNMVHGNKILRSHRGLGNVLKLMYPTYKWEAWKFTRVRKKSNQQLLKVFIEELFPNTEIKYDLKHKDVIFNGKKMELDIFIPSLKLAFEYNGKQHYSETSQFGNCSDVQNRDECRARECQKAGITLITVPYWWDNEMGSLQADIYQSRPDLMPPIILSGENQLQYF